MDNRRMMVNPTNAERAVWNVIAQQFGPNAIATVGYLRSEFVLPATGITSIQFPIGVGDGAQRPSERRLKNNDAFCATHIGVFIGRRVLANPASSAILHTFPNNKVFTTELPAVQGFYAGNLAIRVNETVYIDGLDLLSFLRADTAQQGEAVSTVAVTGITGASAWEGDRAFKKLVPTITFNGLGNNLVTANLPESLTLGSAVVADENVAIFMARGFTIQNGASSRPN